MHNINNNQSTNASLTRRNWVLWDQVKGGWRKILETPFPNQNRKFQTRLNLFSQTVFVFTYSLY